MSFFSKHRLLIEIIAVLVVIFGISILANYEAPATVVDSVVETVAPPPPMTELMTEVLEKSTGFQHLVSYTDYGFGPAVLVVKKGETVRFVNNSQHDLWVASSALGGGRLYPSDSRETCGQSAFDSCVSMKPMEFWEFTFDAGGEWSYRNNASSESPAVIAVL